jgi:hypothetical protein
MNGAGAAAAGGAAAAAAIANAIKASGAIVRVDPGDFRKIVARGENQLVVIAPGGFFRNKHNYLTSYRGLFFFTRAAEPLSLPGTCEVVKADKIWIPG